MSQIKTKFITDLAVTKEKVAGNAIDGTKLRLSNSEFLRSRNAANSGDINVLQVNASNEIVFGSTPKVGSDNLATEAFVSARLEGLKPKEAVRAATTANITLSGTQTIDGVSLVAGNRVLVKDQTAAEDNGIYVVASGAWSRSDDMNSLTPIDEINGAYTFVQQGSANQGKGFVVANAVTVLGTSDIDWVFFNSSSGLVGGNGITISGNDVSVDHDGLGLQFNASQLSLELDGATLSKSSAGVKVADAGVTSTQLADDAVTSSKIAASSVTEAKLADESVTTDKIGSAAVTTAKIATSAVVNNSINDGAVSTNKLADGAVTDLKLATDSVTSIKVASGAITEAKLADSAVTSVKLADSAVTSDKLAANSVTTAKITDGNVTAAKLASDVAGQGLDSTSGVLSLSVARESSTLVSGDITAQSVLLANKYVPNSVILHVSGSPTQIQGVDYTITNTGATTQINFIGDLGTGGNAALVAGDILYVQGALV